MNRLKMATTNVRRRYGTAENLLYAAQAGTGAFGLLVMGPSLLSLFGVLNETDAAGCSEMAALSLGLPALAAFGFLLVLSLVALARGPAHLRSRLAFWYILGPGVFIASTVLDPERMNAFSPGYDTLASVSLVAACALPVIWLRNPVS